MERRRGELLFLNFGHALDHLFMLLFPTVVLSLEAEFQRPYAELLPLALGGFIAFGGATLPAGWLGDRWSRRHMMTLFFVGIGAASIVTGLAEGAWQLAAGLTLIGLFASIYHPIGTAMVVQGAAGVGRVLGVNGVAGNLGVAAAALLAGALTDLIHWRAAFIVPGVVAIATGVAFALFTRPLPGAAAPAAKARQAGSWAGASMVRVLTVLGVATVLGGLVFNSTLVALPKVFEVRMAGLATSTMGVGVLVSLVYTVGAFGQIVVGYLIDRYPLRNVLMAVAALQAPLLLAAANLAGGALLAVAALMMFVVFGAIPITDTIVARNTAEHQRSRVYAIKYVASLGVGSLAVPLVSLVYSTTRDFVVLFGLFAGFAAVIALAATALPRGEGPTVSPQPAGGS